MAENTARTTEPEEVETESAGAAHRATSAPTPTAPVAASPPPEALGGLGDSPRVGLLKKFNPLNLFRRETPASLVRMGKELEDSRHFAQATVAYNKALALDGSYSAAYQGLGDVLVKKGGRANAEAALLKYQESAKRDPLNEKAYKAAARVYGVLGKRKESALEMKKMVVVRTLQTDPGNPAANNNMGILFLQQGQIKPALDYFLRAVKTDARYETALRNLSIAHYKMASDTNDPAARETNLDRAREYIDRALAVAEAPLTLLAQARILILEERFEEALAACEKVEAIDSAMKEVFGLKKVVLMKLNRLEEANKAYETYKFLNAHD